MFRRGPGRGALAVYPVTGWWRERKNQKRWNSEAAYSLIVTLETDAVSAPIYAAIAAETTVKIVGI